MNVRNKLSLTLFLALLSVNAFAGDAGEIVTKPDRAELAIASGSTGTLEQQLTIVNSIAAWEALRAVSSMAAGGTLPLSWISASPSGAFVKPDEVFKTTLSISVPAGTAPGTYAGHLLADARGAHGISDPGTGIALTVRVPDACSSSGTVRIDSFGPSMLWPPNHSLQAVTINGTVLLPSGCTLLEARYLIDDEYGVYSGEDTFTTAVDGTFSIVLPLEASRLGQDKDGRNYTVSVKARDEAGEAFSETLNVLVPHDQRK